MLAAPSRRHTRTFLFLLVAATVAASLAACRSEPTSNAPTTAAEVRVAGRADGAVAVATPSPTMALAATPSTTGSGTPRPAASSASGSPSPRAASSTTAAAMSIDPCRLITADDAATALDGRPFPGSSRTSRESSEVRCTYTVLSGGQGREVVVALWPGSDGTSVYDLRRKVYESAAEDVRGLGDRAFVVRGNEGWVNVLIGGRYLSVELDHAGVDGSERRARALALARLVLSRL